LGVGSNTVFGSGEETEYLVRAIDHGFKSYFIPNLIVYHPNKKPDVVGSDRAFKYGAGLGYVLRRNQFDIRTLATCVVRPIGGMIVSILTLRPRQFQFYLSNFSGRVWGFIMSGWD